jgi:hypothetical protein
VRFGLLLSAVGLFTTVNAWPRNIEDTSCGNVSRGTRLKFKLEGNGGYFNLGTPCSITANGSDMKLGDIRPGDLYYRPSAELMRGDNIGYVNFEGWGPINYYVNGNPWHYFGFFKMGCGRYVLFAERRNSELKTCVSMESSGRLVMLNANLNYENCSTFRIERI